jgi:hypothetical protein
LDVCLCALPSLLHNFSYTKKVTIEKKGFTKESSATKGK